MNYRKRWRREAEEGYEGMRERDRIRGRESRGGEGNGDMKISAYRWKSERKQIEPICMSQACLAYAEHYGIGGVHGKTSYFK